jgi:hypothetical protein
MVDSNSENSEPKAIRQRVFALLNENPLFSSKNICKQLNLSYAEHGAYINNLKSQWKTNRENEQGSNCSSVHAWRGLCCVPTNVDRVLALEVGWEHTEAKNRWLLWKDKFGRMMWFENGTVYLYVKSPVNMGRIKQLVWNGLGDTGRIFDMKILDEVASTIRPTSTHYVFETGQPLPKKTIRYFEKSHGLTIKIGDKSHPTAVEVESRPPDWAEYLASSVQKIVDCLAVDFVHENCPKKPLDYVI